MDQTEFWQSRYEQYGHTGWKNPYVYAFDQELRKQYISKIVDQHSFPVKNALDFGCGRGEFSKFLVEKNFRVYAYDPHIKPDVCHPDIETTQDLDDIVSGDIEFDLLLSVTVLNHILEDDKLRKNLKQLRKLSHETARFLLIEKVFDEPRDQSLETSNGHEVLRTKHELTTILNQTGWKLIASEPVQIPFQTNHEAFQKYLRDPVIVGVRGLVKIFGSKFFPDLLQSVSRTRARSYLETPDLTKPKQSPLKLICCEPIKRDMRE